MSVRKKWYDAWHITHNVGAVTWVLSHTCTLELKVDDYIKGLITKVFKSCLFDMMRQQLRIGSWLYQGG